MEQLVHRRLHEAEIRSTLDAIGIGAWVYEIPSDDLTCSAACARLFGLPPVETQTTLEALLMRVQADDRAALATAVRQAGEGGAFDIAFRLLPGEGELRWLSAKGRARAGERGCVTGIVSEVTEQRAAESELRDAHQRLEFHVQNAPLGVIEWDDDFRVARWSPGAERIFGWSAQEVMGKHPTDWRFIHEDDRRRVDGVMAELVSGRAPRNVSQNRNYTKAGRVVYCEWQNSGLLDERGRLRSMLSLVADVTTRVEVEQARARIYEAELAARREAESASRAKDEFLAILSHELRTPLTAILGWVGVLRARGGDPHAIARAVDAIERNAKAQARIVDDVLDVSRIIAGRLHLTPADVNARSLLEASLDDVRPEREAKDIQLAIDIGPDVGTLRADGPRLKQVFSNLLANAVKFAPRGGHVRVRLAREGAALVLQVTDDGPGIAPEFLPQLFERFKQADSGATRAHRGLGLGLAIAKHLTQLHGGTIEARSEGLGRGATFRVSVPCPPAGATAPDVRSVATGAR